MYITKDKFEEICKKYPTLLLCDGDATDALNFVQDLLEAEADAIKAQEPDATASIDRLKAASWEIYDMVNDIEDEEFWENEVVSEEICSDSLNELIADAEGQKKEHAGKPVEPDLGER